jgi:hypothetical protein
MAGIPYHRPDDRFIPLRAVNLSAALAREAEAFGVSADTLLGVSAVLEDAIDQELAAFEREVAEFYTAFSPDLDTQPLEDIAAARTPEGYRELSARLEYLLTKANFVRLTDAQIRSVVKTANSFGLRVRLRPERLAQLAVWVRGRSHTRRRIRTWRHPWRGQERRLPVYRRLAIVTQHQGDPYVHLKLFKEIPVADVEALLPHADVQMTWFDRLKLVGSSASLVGSTGLKVAKLLGTIIYWSRLLWIVAFGAGLLVWRTFSGYRYACTLRDSIRTKHLYYQNLDNNAGVIHKLVSMIAQEEVKEAVLAYWFCHAGPEAPGSAEELRGRVEAYLAKRFEIQVNFDVEDAIRTLERLGLWADRERLRVVEPAEAHRRLREHWKEGRTIGYHGERVREKNGEA